MARFALLADKLLASLAQFTHDICSEPHMQTGARLAHLGLSGDTACAESHTDRCNLLIARIASSF